MALVAGFVSGTVGPESRRSSRASEIWSLTGDGATTTVTITPRYVKRYLYAVIGAVSADIVTNPQQAAITTLTTIANGAVIFIEIQGQF